MRKDILYARKLFYSIANPMRSLYWFLFRPQLFGVKCVIQYKGAVLLIRHTYGDRKKWRFPGGGMKRREDPEGAMKREVREEVGIRLGAVRKIGEYEKREFGAPSTTFCYLAK